ncbi:MAG: type IX secretion system membrane protein PorP/SprF [Brumimicrobium sp.]
MNQNHFFFFCVVLFSNIGMAQFSSNLSSYNPAMTGLMDKQFGQINYSHQKHSEQIEQNRINGLYNYSADRLNSGFGINFSQIQNAWSNSTIIGGSYQYTFTLSETVKLAVGTSLNYINQNTRGYYQDLFGFNKRHYLRLNFGTAIKWKGLNAGISAGKFDLISHDKPDPIASNPKKNLFNWLNAHVWYDFKIGDNFILSPNVVTGNISNINLRGEHSNRFWWNLGYGFRDYVNLGAGVRVFNQFHVGYGLNLNLKHNPTLFHNFSLSYRLRK